MADGVLGHRLWLPDCGNNRLLDQINLENFAVLKASGKSWIGSIAGNIASP